MNKVGEDLIMEEIIEPFKHYINALSKSPRLKIVLSTIMSIFHTCFKGLGEPLILLGMLIVIDLITGIIKSIKRKTKKEKIMNIKKFMIIIGRTIKSKTMRKGLLKVIQYMLAVLLGGIISQLYGIDYFRILVIYWIVATEIKSIGENSTELGIPLPYIITIFGKDVQKSLEKYMDKIKNNLFK